MNELNKAFNTDSYKYDICSDVFKKDFFPVLWNASTHWSVVSAITGLQNTDIGKKKKKKLFNNVSDILMICKFTEDLYLSSEWPLTRTDNKSPHYLAIGKTNLKAYNYLISSCNNLLWQMNTWEDLCLYNMNSNTIVLVECFHEKMGFIYGNQTLFNKLSITPCSNNTKDVYRINGKLLSSDEYKTLEDIGKRPVKCENREITSG